MLTIDYYLSLRGCLWQPKQSYINVVIARRSRSNLTIAPLVIASVSL